MSKLELLWLYTFLPAHFDDWVEKEKNKIAKDKQKGVAVSHGVWGEKMLLEILAEAKAEFGHYTPQMLQDYKNSHGHCSQTRH